MTISTTELEDRLSATLRGLDHVSLDSPEMVTRGGGHSGAGRFALGAVVVASLVGSGFAWKAQHHQQEASVVYQAGDWSTPYDDMSAVEWNRGLLEDRLGTSTSNVEWPIAAAVAAAESGCSAVALTMVDSVFQLHPESRAMTQRQFVETFGSGFVTTKGSPPPKPVCNLSARPVPPEVRAAQLELRQLQVDIHTSPERMALEARPRRCTHHEPAVDPELMVEVANEIAAHQLEIAAGTYRGIARLLDIDRRSAIDGFQCEAEVYAERRAIEDKYATAYLADPVKVTHLEAAAEFVREMGLTIDI
jgi:hypothetical protein